LTSSTQVSNRVAIVTGAGKGIGRACAIELANNGVSVVVNNRSHAGDEVRSADRVVDEIIANGGQAVANYESIEKSGAGDRQVEQALDQYGRLDAVISNAGVILNKKIDSTSESELREVMEINFFAAVALSQAVLPTLKNAGNGRLIHTISSAGLHGGYGIGGYSASKAALWAYLKSCALEYAKYGVRTNAVAPFADTQMTDGFMTKEVQEQLAPAAVAALFTWLASNACDVNGQTFITAGGCLRVARVGETDTGFVAEHESIELAASQVLDSDISRYFESSIDAFSDICADLSKRTDT